MVHQVMESLNKISLRLDAKRFALDLTFGTSIYLPEIVFQPPKTLNLVFVLLCSVEGISGLTAGNIYRFSMMAMNVIIGNANDRKEVKCIPPFRLFCI